MNTTPEQLYATGRLDEAQAACRQRLATNPTEHGAMHLLGIILIADGKLCSGSNPPCSEWGRMERIESSTLRKWSSSQF